MTPPTKRYFYSDPLAAEWMAEQFGMQFDDLPEPVNWHEDAIPAKMYIRAESLPLLEPRTGDLCKVLWLPGCPESGEAYFPIHIDKTKHDVVAIIQRDGLAFMWPESEGA